MTPIRFNRDISTALMTSVVFLHRRARRLKMCSIAGGTRAASTYTYL